MTLPCPICKSPTKSEGLCRPCRRSLDAALAVDHRELTVAMWAAARARWADRRHARAEIEQRCLVELQRAEKRGGVLLGHLLDLVAYQARKTARRALKRLAAAGLVETAGALVKLGTPPKPEA